MLSRKREAMPLPELYHAEPAQIHLCGSESKTSTHDAAEAGNGFTDAQVAGTTVRVVRGIDALSALVPEWEKLLAAVPSSTVFSSWEWLAPWWHAFGASKELITITLFDDAGRLVGMAPLTFEQRGIAGRGLSVRVVRLMGDGSGDSDNLDLLVLPGYEKPLVAALFEYLVQHAAEWDCAQFNTFSDQSPLPAHLFRELQRHGWTVWSQQRPGVVIDFPRGWNGYLNDLGAKRRRVVKISLRRLEEVSEYRIRKVAPGPGLQADLDAFFDLHERRWKARGLRGAFASRRRQEFYKEMAESFAARGWLEFWFLEVDGGNVAGDFDFRYRDTVYRLQAAFDPARSTHAPGRMLLSQLLRQWVASGVRRYDFLGGDEHYKTHWGGCTRFYRDIHFAIPRTRGSFYLRIGATIAAARAQVRSHLPPGLLRAARRLRRWFQLWTRATAP